MARSSNRRKSKHASRAHGRGAPAEPIVAGAGVRWLTRIATGIAMAVVVARLTMMETLRDPMPVAPDAQRFPAGAGASTSLLLDLLACVPALLVLARRRFDASYTLSFAWSPLVLLGLGVWAVLSTLWASDTFAAAVSSFHLFSAAVMLWAVAQIVRDRAYLRGIAGMCIGLLLVLAATGIYGRFVERPELQRVWQEKRGELLEQRGLVEGSFEAKQFERKVLGGEVMGFSSSANTYAAVIVLLAIVSAGLALDKLRSSSLIAAGAIGLIVIVAAVPTILLTQSRTALVTPLLAAGVLVLLGRLRFWLRRNARLAFTIGIGAAGLAIAFVVIYGIARGSLFHESLTFRWKYWVGAGRLVQLHPLTGVGWENFGPHYLGTRLHDAAEEPKDPHNMLVRFFVELGLVGGVLALAWLVLLWWDLTRPTRAMQPPPAPPPGIIRRPSAGLLIIVGGVGLLISLVASVDRAFPEAVFFDVFKRVVMQLLLAAGLMVALMRVARVPGAKEWSLLPDTRAVRWTRRALLVGLGAFLLHNLLDFSLFENGPLFLFAYLAGTGIGLLAPPAAPSDRRRRWAGVGLIGGSVAWLAILGVFVVPVIMAETAARDGDESLRTRRFAQAANRYEQALEHVPYNADYAARTARVWMYVRQYGRAIPMLERAIALDPASASHRLALARCELARQQPDAGRVIAAFEQAMALDPANVPARVEFADGLERLGRPSEAAAQLEKALWYDAQLLPHEPERMNAERVAAIRKRIEGLRAGPTTRSGQ